ncbi:MAG: hypothetical protein Q9202_006475 [Teloschistes flavicans]
MTTNSPQTAEEALVELISAYHELNGNYVDELEQPPSPLDFLQYVARNRPFVVRKAAVTWPAVSLWSSDYLAAVMKDSTVKVAITPSGSEAQPVNLLISRELNIDGFRNADSAVWNPVDGKLNFAKPLEIDEKFEDFLSHVRRQEVGEAPATGLENKRLTVRENDNMRGEYSSLYSDIAADIPWATESFGASPDAVNLWIGNSRSVTSLHKDNYENIYCQIRGRKCFVLLPPIETPCVNITDLEQAVYAHVGEDGFSLVREASKDKVPWPIWDPDKPDINQTALSYLSRPLRVELAPGDLLYLPTLW